MPGSRWTTTTDKSVIHQLCWADLRVSTIRISNFSLEFQISLKTLLLLHFLFDYSEFFTRETRHVVPSCNKARIHVVYFKNNYYWMYCQILQRSAFWPTGQLVKIVKGMQKICQSSVWPIENVKVLKLWFEFIASLLLFLMYFVLP